MDSGTSARAAPQTSDDGPIFVEIEAPQLAETVEVRGTDTTVPVLVVVPEDPEARGVGLPHLLEEIAGAALDESAGISVALESLAVDEFGCDARRPPGAVDGRLDPGVDTPSIIAANPDSGEP